MVKSSSTFIAVLVGATVGVQPSGCAVEHEEAADSAEAFRDGQLETDGEALFRELLFPNAEAARAVPELRRLYDHLDFERLEREHTFAVLAMQDLFVERIVAADPSFMDRFGEQITSGDVLAVDAAMKDAKRLVLEAMLAWSSDLEHLRDADAAENLGAQDEPDEISSAFERLDPEVLDEVVATIHAQLAHDGLPTLPDEFIETAVTVHRLPTRIIDLPQLDTVRSNFVQTIRFPTRIPALYADLAQPFVVDPAQELTREVVDVVSVLSAMSQWVAKDLPVEASFLNGQSAALFREQLTASIARAYAE